jgi:peptidyl-prolyl isomerase D
LLTSIPSECGELKGPDADISAIRQDDGTGDKYEDFPDDEDPEMNGETIARIAAEIKEFGNKAFKAGDLELGLDKYQKGLRYLAQWPTPEDNDPPTLWPTLQQLRFTMHNNSALLYNKQKNWREAIECATKALQIEGIEGKDRAKALFRRATAKISTNNDEEAVEDLAEAHKLAPADGLIVKELEAARARISARKEKEKAAYKKFFG